MKRIFNRCVACLFLVILFAMVISSPVFAGDKDCNDPKWADHPICTGGDPDPDPGDETMTLENIYAWWSGRVRDQLSDGSPYYGRFCQASGTISNGFVGYGCPWENEVVFNMFTSPDVATGKEAADLCPMLSSYFVLGGSNGDIGVGRITAYHFTIDPTWNDGKCTGADASCLVRVRMTAYFDDWCNDKGKCGRLVLVWGWGNATPADGMEINPFVNDQVIDIHDLEVFFKDIGTNRDVAHCRWYNSNVQFITDNPNR